MYVEFKLPGVLYVDFDPPGVLYVVSWVTVLCDMVRIINVDFNPPGVLYVDFNPPGVLHVDFNPPAVLYVDFNPPGVLYVVGDSTERHTAWQGGYNVGPAVPVSGGYQHRLPHQGMC